MKDRKFKVALPSKSEVFSALAKKDMEDYAEDLGVTVVTLRKMLKAYGYPTKIKLYRGDTRILLGLENNKFATPEGVVMESYYSVKSAPKNGIVVNRFVRNGLKPSDSSFGRLMPNEDRCKKKEIYVSDADLDITS